MSLIARRNEESTATDQQEADRWFLEQYLSFLTRRFSQAEIFGIDGPQRARVYDLQIAYLSLCTTHHEAATDQQPVEHALASQKRLLLTGRAGSGKTTILSWLILRASSRRLEGDLAYLNSYLPLLVTLREHVHDGKLSLPRDIEELLLHKGFVGATSRPERLVLDYLVNGKLLLLIDGYDEVPENLREEVQSWIVSLHEMMLKHEENVLVVTSRDYALTGHSMPLEEHVIQDLSPQQVDVFVQKWYEAYAEQLPTERERVECADRLASLRRQIASPSLSRLARLPLLAAVICSINAESTSLLPTERDKLYASCLKMFFARDEVRRIQSGLPRTFEPRVLENCLQSLAYYMLKNGLAEVHKTIAVEHVRDALPRLGISAEHADTVVELLLLRVGLLRKVGEDSVDFPHLLLRDYLAAGEIIRVSDYGLLRAKASDSYWRETITLTVGRGQGSPDSIAIIEDLLRESLSSGRTEAEKFSLAVLALDCAEGVGSLEPNVRHVLSERLKGVFPPTSDAGERMLIARPELSKRKLFEAKLASEAHQYRRARVLLAIGDDDCLDLLLRERGNREFVSEAAFGRAALDQGEPKRHRLLSGWKVEQWVIERPMDALLAHYVSHIACLRFSQYQPPASIPRATVGRFYPVVELPDASYGRIFWTDLSAYCVSVEEMIIERLPRPISLHSLLSPGFCRAVTITDSRAYIGPSPWITSTVECDSVLEELTIRASHLVVQACIEASAISITGSTVQVSSRASIRAQTLELRGRCSISSISIDILTDGLDRIFATDEEPHILHESLDIVDFVHRKGNYRYDRCDLTIFEVRNVCFRQFVSNGKLSLPVCATHVTFIGGEVLSVLKGGALNNVQELTIANLKEFRCTRRIKALPGLRHLRLLRIEQLFGALALMEAAPNLQTVHCTSEIESQVRACIPPTCELVVIEEDAEAAFFAGSIM